MKCKTEQEDFWLSEFGDRYIDRNKEWKNNLHLFSKILSSTKDINTIIEFGCNIGLNLKALNQLLPKASLTGVEINKKACSILDKWDKVNVINRSILDLELSNKFDLVLSKTVLIHINPNMLEDVYKKLYNLSNRYIIIAEYYNPKPVQINYRGHTERLFKRDFAGEMLDKYPDLKLIDYGFAYHRDNNFPQDDINWFLLEKV